MIFISYSHDSPAHVARVLALAERLREDGLETSIDQYVDSPPEAWPLWMDRQIASADFVLVVCSETYTKRLLGEQPGRGHGAKWEGALITQAIYDAESLNQKIVPVLFDAEVTLIPRFLRAATYYVVSDEKGYESLYRRLTQQPRVVPRPVGNRRTLRPDVSGRQGAINEMLVKARSPLPNLAADRSARLREFLSQIRAFVLSDQIQQSGGWAQSQVNIFEHTTGHPPTAIDLREGGIISTYLAIRALLAVDVRLTTHAEPGRSAAAYLLHRQNGQGLFGRYSVSRSGEEIRGSFRHTALACMTLMLLDGPPDPIVKGLRALARITPREVVDDSAPSIAAAVVIVALDLAANGIWTATHLPRTVRNEMSRTLETIEPQLMLRIESASKNPRSEYAPLWEPYGRSKQMLLDSALTTIDFLTLCPRPPWSSILTALEWLSRHRGSTGLQYGPASPEPDVGMSIYFSAICFRHSVAEKLREGG